ncbi:hypothetical protein NZD89_05135 [Alicyclobacillus fastidiosus]|uniref:Small EDRK-rich factor-like N-terminal domain-containing protein n=1 Tax=Alicyclobacillus fastidiosus TaxID=392011 RepID=A0ABY6ZJZ9_9BACL|nr:hypothetical protein [Alicyclobacillus fastidiosus]WAH42817.1 hypothetical protein NZD89_05135 [Alicyclobacillus fastidiosus]GMA64741.1 hypothetical protein GCM10025859_51810 [Alicyclobacillus fastidiosus]
MPKAENRKKPPNIKGQVPGRGNQNQSANLAMNAERDNIKNKKQDIIEKMKSIQRGKNQQ